MAFERVCVVGLGYIGLPTAAMFASRKKQVIGVDIREDVVETINSGKIHIVEPELDEMVDSAVNGGFLRASVNPYPADAFLIAVPTPFSDGYKPDLSYIEAAAKSIAPVLARGNLVVLESTSPVGATEKVAGWLADLRPDLSFPQQAGEQADINVSHCPERVLPGRVVKELVENDRVVGGMTVRCSTKSVELYKTFVTGECVITNSRTAELAKLTENASRDVGIAFANELSMICDELDVNVWELISLANRHPRVNILQPGPGVGGHCIAVDPWFIVSSAPRQAKLIRVARSINDGKPGWVLDKVNRAIANILLSSPHRSASELTVACLGLAFKADIDDLRESPAVTIAQKLATRHAGSTLAVEPNIQSLPASLNGSGLCLADMEDALDRADVLVLLVDHREFKDVAPARLIGKVIVDTRGIWSEDYHLDGVVESAISLVAS